MKFKKTTAATVVITACLAAATTTVFAASSVSDGEDARVDNSISESVPTIDKSDSEPMTAASSAYTDGAFAPEVPASSDSVPYAPPTDITSANENASDEKFVVGSKTPPAETEGGSVIVVLHHDGTAYYFPTPDMGDTTNERPIVTDTFVNENGDLVARFVRGDESMYGNDIDVGGEYQTFDENEIFVVGSETPPDGSCVFIERPDGTTVYFSVPEPEENSSWLMSDTYVDENNNVVARFERLENDDENDVYDYETDVGDGFIRWRF